MGDRRSFWAWCMESEEPTDADRAALAAQAVRTVRHRDHRPTGAPGRGRRAARRRASRCRTGCRRGATRRRTSGRSTPTAPSFTDRTRAFNLRVPEPARRRRPSRATSRSSRSRSTGATANGYVAIPYGGGSSVVWGVNPPDDCGPCVTIALDRLDRVLEIDDVSRAARIQAGVLGPALEQQLKPSGHTLRHFPQSFRFSSLGGWIVTRSGGHYATNHTHIDDFVESVRMLTPRGWWESRRLPGSGAGPSPDRMVIGSRRDPRRRHRGVDADPEAADVPRHRRDHVRLVGGRLRRGADDRAGQAVAGQPAASSIRSRPVAPPASTARRRW